MRRFALPTLSPGPRRRLWIALALLLLGDLLWTLLRFPAHSRERTFTEGGLPRLGSAVLILGAGVYSDKEPTPVLQGRLETALRLYREGKVRWFLVSGDNRTPQYNEPQAMRRWLIRQGVPGSLIIPDYAGRRTYDSLKRAHVVFGLRRVVLVTSDFHLPRALFLGTNLGLDAYGVPASTEVHGTGTRLGFWFREYLARHVALWDSLFPPDLVLGPREPTPDDWASEPGSRP